MDAIVDRGLSTEECAQVDLPVLLRYVHLSATCVDDPITHTVRAAISPNNPWPRSLKREPATGQATPQQHPPNHREASWGIQP